MLISTSHKFVFIHVPKCAGDAIGATLQGLCGGKWTYSKPQLGVKHLNAKQIRAKFFGDGTWDQYFRFGVVRNPWDQVHSDYCFCRSQPVPPVKFGSWREKVIFAKKYTFKDFVVRECSNGEMGLWAYYLTDHSQNQIVSFVAKYEQLEKDWKLILDEIGAPFRPLPRVNVTPNRRPYQDAYDTLSKDRVAVQFNDDIRRFDYEFEGNECVTYEGNGNTKYHHAEPPQKLAVVACHFNPQQYKRPAVSLHRFIDNMEKCRAELWMAELAFDNDPFVLEESYQCLQLRGTRAKNLLWQKEKILNTLIRRIPLDRAIAWLDADVLFENLNWVEEARQKLGSCRVLQLFRHATMLDSMGTAVSDKSYIKSIGACFEEGYSKFNDLGYSHPGFAWAGRRDWIDRHGLCDLHVLGGGDVAMLRAFTGIRNYHEKELTYKWTKSQNTWSVKAHRDIQNSFGAISGTLYHQYHGTEENRQYTSRWNWLQQYEFDPCVDVVENVTGLWQWSEKTLATKPELVRVVSDYFRLRQEDD